ncbi:hypothetical protein ACNKHN_10750 [Shigella flexneri]
MQRYLGQNAPASIQQQRGLVSVGHAAHPRYGIGETFVGAAVWTKWALYVIGQCCDQ